MTLRALLPPLVVATLLGGATYAAAATRSGSGSGSAVVSGYRVAGVHFETDERDPRDLVGVTFSLEPAPGPQAKATVRLRSDGSWYPCRLDGSAATCPTPGASLGTTDDLAVTVDG